jgi:hypothetical protein
MLLWCKKTNNIAQKKNDTGCFCSVMVSGVCVCVFSRLQNNSESENLKVSASLNHDDSATHRPYVSFKNICGTPQKILYIDQVMGRDHILLSPLCCLLELPRVVLLG